MNMNCVVRFDTRTLVVSRLFLKMASVPFSEEYDMLARLTKQHPGFTVIVKVTARRKVQFMSTYNDMLDYEKYKHFEVLDGFMVCASGC